MGHHHHASSYHTTYKSVPYFKLRQPPAPGIVAAAAAATWSVPNLCAAYNWPTGLAGGGVIAIVELGGGWVQSDMDSFFPVHRPAVAADHRRFGGRHNEQPQSERRLRGRSGLRGRTRHPGVCRGLLRCHRQAGDHPRVLVAGHCDRGSESNR